MRRRNIYPVSLMQPSEGLGAFVQENSARDTFLVQQMHALSIAIYQAKQRDEPQTVMELLKRFTALANEYRDRGALDMGPIDRFILTVGDYIADSSTAAKQIVKEAARTVGETLGEAVGPIQGALIPIAIGLVAVAFIMGGGIKMGKK